MGLVTSHISQQLAPRCRVLTLDICLK